jgi:RNA polymerase sigma factor (sigma-70 family)
MDLKGMPCNLEEFNRFQLGDEAVFRKIFVFYKPILFQKFNKFCTSSLEVEEVLQEVFVQLFLKRQQIPNVDSIFPFLYVVGKRMSISSFRKALVREQYQLDNPSQWNEACDYLDAHIESKDLSDLLECILKDLPSRQQIIFRMNKLNELSYKEIAEEIGISQHTVRNHLAAACTFVRLKLDKILLLLFFIKINF